MDTLKKIRANLPPTARIRQACSENGCSAACANQGVIVQGESLAARDEKAVDCIFFLPVGGVLCIVLVELKRGGYSVNDIADKMCSSEIRARDVATKATIAIGNCVRYVFAGQHPRVATSEYVLLVKKARVIMKRCGTNIKV